MLCRDCIGGILGLEDGFPSDLVIVGDELLKSCAYILLLLILLALFNIGGSLTLHCSGYSVYDYPGSRVGLAPSINNKA